MSPYIRNTDDADVVVHALTALLLRLPKGSVMASIYEVAARRVLQRLELAIKCGEFEK